jgi:hypothetical protein
MKTKNGSTILNPKVPIKFISRIGNKPVTFWGAFNEIAALFLIHGYDLPWDFSKSPGVYLLSFVAFASCLIKVGTVSNASSSLSASTIAQPL